MLLASFFVCCAALGAQPPSAAPPRADEPATSVERVRKRLTKPASRLAIPDREPDFKVHIIEGSILDALERDRFLRHIPSMFEVTPGPRPVAGLRTPFGSQPLVAFDVAPFAGAIASAVSTVWRGRAQAAAREEVVRRIAEYCAAQPDRGSGIQICSIVPAR